MDPFKQTWIVFQAIKLAVFSTTPPLKSMDLNTLLSWLWTISANEKADPLNVLRHLLNFSSLGHKM